MSRRVRSSALVMALLVGVVPSARAQSPAPCDAAATALRAPVALPREAPQDLAVDPRDGSVWIAFGLSLTLYRLDVDLGSGEDIPLELPPAEGVLFDGLTGLAFDTARDTLLVVRPGPRAIVEVTRDGHATGREIPLDLPSPPTIDGRPMPRALRLDPFGGPVAFRLVESVMSAVYGLGPDGAVIESFCHPDDPDGCPGDGVAAPAAGLALADGDGAPGLDLVGGLGRRRDRLVRVTLDGEPTGVEWPLDLVGGVVSGVERASWRDPTSGELRRTLLVLVESSAELWTLATPTPQVLAPRELEAETRRPPERGVRLRWRSHPSWRSVEVTRDGLPLAILPSDAESFEDTSAPEGILDYRVRAIGVECDAEATVRVVHGPGAALDSRRLEGAEVVDLTEDGDGVLWLVLSDDRLRGLDRDLADLFELDGPFDSETATTTAIAAAGDRDSLFVYDSASHRIAEVDLLGELVREPFASGVDLGLDPEEAVVTAMVHDPLGAGGDGSLWLLETRSGRIEERDLEGTLLRRCVHPDTRREPPPADSELRSWTWGLTAERTASGLVLETSGGLIRDLRSTRLLRLDPDSCAPTGSELPVAALEAYGVPARIALHRSRLEGRPVVYAVLSRRDASTIVRLDGAEFSVPPVGELRCRAIAEGSGIEIEWLHPGDVDVVEISRDGALIATTAPETGRHLDDDATPGPHEYSVRARRGDERSDERRCVARAGPGAILERVFAHPLSSVHAIARDPEDGSFYAASRTRGRFTTIWRRDAALLPAGEIASPFSAPFSVAALAVRRADGQSELHALGWIAGAEPGDIAEFPVEALRVDGAPLGRWTARLPPPPGVRVTFPSGLAWDEATDSFWILERNAERVYRFSPEGEPLDGFDHPAPLLQDGVENHGIAVAADRGTLWLSTGGPLDRAVTRLVEVTRRGRPTGFEVAFPELGAQLAQGFTVDSDGVGFVLAAGSPGPWDLVRVRGADPIAAPAALECDLVEGHIRLTWAPAADAESHEMRRGLEVAAVLPGDASTWTDPEPWTGDGFYRLAARRGRLTSAGLVCEPRYRVFRRGDATGDDRLEISDAIATLAFLFLGAATPACLDAADVDDSGELSIADPIRLLGFLFLGGAPPPPPVDRAGLDPTEDDLDCAGP